MPGPHRTAPKVSSEVFLGHHWVVAAILLCFVALRIGVRVKYFHRIWADDILILGAWAMLFASAALWQYQSTSLYNQYPLMTGKLPPTPERLAMETNLLRSEAAQFYLFLGTLYSVKLSVLIFFRRLFSDCQRAPWLKTWWWFITGFTVAAWAACIGTIPYSCLLNPLPYILAQCANQNKIDYTWINLILSSATDVLTDAMILTIPVLRLWNVQISLRKKLALMSILSLTFIIIIFAIIRPALMPNKTSAADISWLCLWAHVEAGVAVIVSCLASFRQLFVKSKQASNAKPISHSTYPWWKSSSYSNSKSSRIKGPLPVYTRHR